MTFHPTTPTELHSALEDPSGPRIIDCDVLKETFGTNDMPIGAVAPVPNRDIEVNFRGLRLWTDLPGGTVVDYAATEGVDGCGLRMFNAVWSTNADIGGRFVNSNGLHCENVRFAGADTGWTFGKSGVDGQSERIRLDGCGAVRTKHDCLVFDGGSFHGFTADAFEWHHHDNPDGGETAYAMRAISGSVYHSDISLYGWQDDKETNPTLTGGNKGFKIHSAANIQSSKIHYRAENGGAYMGKIELPLPSYEWEGPHARQKMALDFISIECGGVWPYAYGMILDGGPTAGAQFPSGMATLEEWIDLSRVTVTGGHMVGYGKEANRIVGIGAGGAIIYPQ